MFKILLFNSCQNTVFSPQHQLVVSETNYLLKLLQTHFLIFTRRVISRWCIWCFGEPMKLLSPLASSLIIILVQQLPTNLGLEWQFTVFLSAASIVLNPETTNKKIFASV